MTVARQREQAFEALERGPLDVLIVGGGIVGSGIARDLALRGLKVALVEQRDLASGTSSRPTRLIHGGLRYLENFDFALVRTDMREREVLLRLAPHLVQPLRFLMPMYSRGVLYRAKLQAGMQLYDALSFDKSLPTRQWLNRRQVLRAEPGLNPLDLQGYSLVGTTDTDYQGDPADVAATAEDVEYLVEEARRAFPGGRFDEVHYTWAGVRALVRVEHVSEGKVSRKHALHDHGRRDGVPGIVSVVGGKITGYRAIAEEVGDLVARKLGHPGAPDSETHLRPLPGGHLADLQTYVTTEIWPRAQALGLDRQQAEHLGSLYGSLAPSVLARAETDASLTERLCPHQPTIGAQMRRAIDDEWALSLGDVLLRRTPLGLDACQALDCLDNVAARMAGMLGWDANERARQIEAYRTEVEPMRRYSRSAAAA